MPGAAQIGPLAQRDQRGAVRREHGRRERVGERQQRRRRPRTGPSASRRRARARTRRGASRATIPSSPSAYGRASRDASTTPALTREREPGDEPGEAPEQHRPEDDEQPGGERDGDRGRQPQRELVCPRRSCELEQEQPACLAGSSWTIRESTVPSEPCAAAAAARLVGRERAVPERDDAERERAEGHADGREPPGELARRARCVRRRRCPRSRVEATCGLGYCPCSSGRRIEHLHPEPIAELLLRRELELARPEDAVDDVCGFPAATVGAEQDERSTRRPRVVGGGDRGRSTGTRPSPTSAPRRPCRRAASRGRRRPWRRASPRARLRYHCVIWRAETATTTTSPTHRRPRVAQRAMVASRTAPASARAGVITIAYRGYEDRLELRDQERQHDRQHDPAAHERQAPGCGRHAGADLEGEHDKPGRRDELEGEVVARRDGDHAAEQGRSTAGRSSRAGRALRWQ